MRGIDVSIQDIVESRNCERVIDLGKEANSRLSCGLVNESVASGNIINIDDPSRQKRMTCEKIILGSSHNCRQWVKEA